MEYRYLIRIVVVLVITITIYLRAGNFLIVDETPKKSDVIVVLAGDYGNRLKFGVNLFKEGYSDHLLFSGGRSAGNTISEAELMTEQSITLGIPVEKIILEDKANSTYENALYSKQLVDKYKFKSAIIVTSNYHMRRSRLVFNKAFQGTGINLTYCSALEKSFTPNGWFTDKYSRDIVFSEYIKIVGYWIEDKL